MIRFFTRQFFTGFITILPLALTLYLLYWFFVSTEKALGSVLQFLLPNSFYWPGMGLLVGIALIFCVGLLMRLYVVKLLFDQVEKLVYHMPLIKSVYGAIRDFLNYFSSNNQQDDEHHQVVAVSFDNGMELIGIITVNSAEQLPVADDDHDDKVLVYLPMSYNIGGYPLLVPRRRVRPVDMTMEQAMRFALTAGVAGHDQQDGQR